ncbi:MAG: presqualene diphosphate synthase HpnD [Gammaproteobacteria bacterium]|nr:presqualene diphosphate synthase HpnD [Gammaproteobacteria bacterium]
MTPDEYCQQKAGSSGSSFYYSFLFLPPVQRQAMTALYAFCREVDDVVDDCTDTNVARATLNWWRAEVENTFNGKPQHPVTRALATSLEHFDLQDTYFHELIAGMEMDLTRHRYSNFDELKLYCYRAASVVGLLSARIFGYENNKTEEYAVELGIAFQLTNIIRDVGEDARRQRIYLPGDELSRFNVSEHELIELAPGPGFDSLMQFQAQRARQYYSNAFRLLPGSDRCRQRPGLVMAAIYSRLLDKLEQNRFPVLQKRLGLAPINKLWIAWRTSVQEKRGCRE